MKTILTVLLATTLVTAATANACPNLAGEYPVCTIDNSPTKFGFKIEQKGNAYWLHRTWSDSPPMEIVADGKYYSTPDHGEQRSLYTCNGSELRGETEHTDANGAIRYTYSVWTVEEGRLIYKNFSSDDSVEPLVVVCK